METNSIRSLPGNMVPMGAETITAPMVANAPITEAAMPAIRPAVDRHAGQGDNELLLLLRPAVDQVQERHRWHQCT